MSKKTTWIAIKDKLPPKGLIVETKIDDKDGVRNITNLVRDGILWFFPDYSMYVYYTPTHWRTVKGKDKP